MKKIVKRLLVMIATISMGVVVNSNNLKAEAKINPFPTSYRHTWYRHTSKGYAKMKFTKYTRRYNSGKIERLNHWIKGFGYEYVISNPNSDGYRIYGFNNSDATAYYKVSSTYLNGKKRTTMVIKSPTFDMYNPYSYQYWYRNKVKRNYYKSFPKKYRGTWKPIKGGEKLRISSTAIKGGGFFGAGLSTKRNGLVCYYSGKNLVINIRQNGHLVGDAVSFTVKGHTLTMHGGGATMQFRK